MDTDPKAVCSKCGESLAIPVPRLTALFLSIMAELRASGVSPTDEQTVTVYECCRRCIIPTGRDYPPFMPPSVDVGTVTLRPLTIAGALWLEDFAAPWFAGDPRMDLYCVAWAMAHGDQPDAIARASQGAAIARRMIRRWGFWLVVSDRHLSGIVDFLLGRHDGAVLDIKSIARRVKNNPAESQPNEWGPFISRLCAAYGLPPRHFLYEMTSAAALDMDRNRPGPDGQPRPAADGDSAEAFNALRSLVAHIKGGTGQSANIGGAT
jgi:hypothetical protein